MNTRDLRQLVLFIGGTLIALIIIVTGVIFIIQSDPDDRASRSAGTRMLFIGNSYTAYNQLDQMTAEVMQRTVPGGNTVLGVAVAPGGYRMPQHLADALNTQAAPPLNQYLVSGDEDLRRWDLVVMQGQSQIPGLNPGDFAEVGEFFSASQELGTLAQDTGATVMLYMTWGRRNGDPENREVYPDYLTMQSRLTFAYDSLAEQMSTPENPVYVAPVGLGFQTVYNDIAAQGLDPRARNSDFFLLYEADGSHPTEEGSYLAALIISASYTGQPVSDMTWKPFDMDADYAAYLRDVADRTVFGDLYPDRPYPWR